MLRHIVIAEWGSEGAGVFEADQLPAGFVAVAAPGGAGKKAHDGVPAERLEEFGMFDLGSRFAARGSEALAIDGALIGVERGERAVDEVDDAGLFGAGAGSIRGDDLRGEALDLRRRRRVEILEFAFTGIWGRVRVLL